MRNLKILHLSTDNKFLDYAFPIFNEAFPGRNSSWIFTREEKVLHVKETPFEVVRVGKSVFKQPTVDPVEYSRFDLVIFHSFADLLYPEIFNIPDPIPTVWIGWGYDYYFLASEPGELLLDETRALSKTIEKSVIRRKTAALLRRVFKQLGLDKSCEDAIGKVSVFSPVLPNEYSIVKNSQNWKRFPDHGVWNYGTIEDNFLKGIEGEEVSGNSILIGNSASLTGNHLEAFQLLKTTGLKGRGIIAPLSYGDQRYGHAIYRVGEQYFGDDFQPLLDFMPIQDYVAKMKECGFAIMNHRRQQAVGNIVILLYLGSRVFLREENPAYRFFKDMGVELSSVQELQENHALLEAGLSREERDTNRRLICSYWSREKGVEKTKALVRQALAKTVNEHLE